MSNLFSQLNTRNILSSANNIAIVNQSNQIASLTSDLNQKYINNNGCLIKIFTFNNDATNNIYLKIFNRFIDVLFKIYNKQFVIINRELSLDSDISPLVISSALDKSTFNNINILINFIETIGTLDITNIKNIYETGINKDTQGNYPSLFISLLPEQIEKILENKLVQSYYQNRIPILLPYGQITPYIFYKKYIQDKTTQHDINRTIESYILNMGPCNLDYISAMFNFHRLNKIYQNFQNNEYEFQKRFENIEYDNKFGLRLKYGHGDPNNLTAIKQSENNQDFLKNFKFGPKEYDLDLSNEYVFYIGINNDYGWNNPIEFIKSFSNSYNIYEFDQYNSSSNININFRKSNSNLSELSYNNFIEDIVNNFDNFTENNINERLKTYSTNNNIKNDEIEYYLDIFKNNPKVYAIKVPLYQTAEEYNNNTIGLGVLDAWNLIDSIITSKNLDISKCSIFLQCYGKMCDYTTLNYLYNKSQYIKLTYGSAFDFIEKNFVNLNNSIQSFDKLKFDGLYSVKPYNAFSPNYFALLNNIIIKLKNQIELDNIFKNLDDSIDQFQFFETLVLINQIGLFNLNTILKNGIQSNTESLTLNYKIPTGFDFFMNNNDSSFNIAKIFNSQSVDNDTGIADQKLLFQNLIGHSYNYGLYTQSNNAYPFIRNNSFSLYERTYEQLSITNENVTIKYKYHPIYHNGYAFFPNFIQSHSYLVNSLIFKLNNSTRDENIEVNKFFDEFFNYGLIKTVDNSYYTVKIDPLDNQRPFYLLNSYMWNYASEKNIKEILIGNFFKQTEALYDQLTDTVEKIIIGKNILEIPESFCNNKINLQYVNFLMDSSLSIINNNAFANCISLNNLILPNSVTYIGSRSFENTTDLSNLQLSNNLSFISEHAFIRSGITNLDLNKINNIGNSAFEDCQNLINVTFDNSCTIVNINDNTFKNCVNLQNITLCSSINYLNQMSFKNCRNLQEINFHSNINFIGYDCFSECASLTTINLRNTSVSSIQDRTFANCTSLKSCILPESLFYLGNNVFDGCQDLSFIIIQSAINTHIFSNIFLNIPNDVIIYYFSNLTPTNYFDNIPNKILVDLYSNLPNYVTYNYYEVINIQKDNELILKPFYIEFFIEDIKINIDYSYSESGDFIDTTSIGNYNKIYNILYLNNLQFNLTSNINVLDQLVNSQILNVFGNNNLYYNAPENLSIQNIKNLYLDYGVLSKDINGINVNVNIINELDDITSDNFQKFDTDNKIYKIKYYSLDNSYNYKSYIKNIYYYSEEIIRKNIKIFKEKSRFEIIQENDIIKGKLYFTLLNDGNFSFESALLLKSSNLAIPELNSYKFLFPIFSILDPISGTQGSVDLTHINGPQLDTFFNYYGNNHVFTNRLDSSILNGSTLKILNSYSQYNIAFKEINNLSNFRYEQSWGLTKGLKKNEYIDFELTFNYFGTCDDMILQKNNIFTKNNTFGIFSDNGTSANISGGTIHFYDNGYFKEVDYNGETGLDTFDVSNDNVFKFTINYENAILNGLKNIYIENGMFYKDFGSISLINNYPNNNLSYFKFPQNTYNSNEISMNYGIYEISYAIFPFGFFDPSENFEYYRQLSITANQTYIVELSRNITIINYNNPDKPNIFLGDGLEQNILVGTHSINSNNNYALSYNGEVLPLFKEIRLDNYDICGTFYEYFYSYDDSGNYNSVKRTINVTSHQFSSIAIKPLFSFENYYNNFVIRLENKGTIDYNLTSNNTFIDFKIISNNYSNIFSNSFTLNSNTYYYDPTDQNKFNLSNYNITINSNTQENISYTINNSQLNLNGIIKSNSCASIIIQDITNNLRPIIAVLNNLPIEDDSTNISLYEEKTSIISLERSSIIDIVNNNFKLKIKNNSNSNYNTLTQDPINLYFYKMYKGVTSFTDFYNNIQFNNNDYHYAKDFTDQYFWYLINDIIISTNSDISYSITNNSLSIIGEISNNTEIIFDLLNLTRTNFTIGVFLNNDVNVIFSESPCVFIYENNTNLVANKTDSNHNFKISITNNNINNIDISNILINVNGNNLLENFYSINDWAIDNGNYINDISENKIILESNSSIYKNIDFTSEINTINFSYDIVISQIDLSDVNIVLLYTNNYYSKEIFNKILNSSESSEINLRNNICLTNYIPQDNSFYVYFKNDGLVPTDTRSFIFFTIFEITEDINLSDPNYNNFSFTNNNKNYYFKNVYYPPLLDYEFILTDITSTIYDDNYPYSFVIFPVSLYPNSEIFLKLKQIQLNSNSIYAFILDHGYYPDQFVQNHGYIFETIEIWDNNSDNIVVIYT